MALKTRAFEHDYIEVENVDFVFSLCRIPFKKSFMKSLVSPTEISFFRRLFSLTHGHRMNIGGVLILETPLHPSDSSRAYPFKDRSGQYPSGSAGSFMAAPLTALRK